MSDDSDGNGRAVRDGVQRFIFEDADVRGEIVQLDSVVRDATRHHAYPPEVASLIASALAATSLLMATVKMTGRVTLQIQGDGPVDRVVVQARTEGSLRATARCGSVEAADGEEAGAGLGALCGRGHLAITLEPDGQERYQGVVELDQAGLAPTLERYFQNSEQLPTRIVLSGEPERSGGLLLQRLPDVVGSDADAWNRIEQLGTTVRGDELLDLDAEEVLHRLFHQERVRVFEPQPLGFRCKCSDGRVGGILRGLGREEVHSILAEQGQVEVRCEFCGAVYRYDAVDAEAALAGDTGSGVRGSGQYH